MDEILVVDDDRELCALLREFLQAEQFMVSVVHDGQAALEYLRQQVPALVLLDVMMPGLDGFETLRRLRRDSEVPVLMLTARGEEIDRVVGLEMGADDYLPKPFSHRELLARIRAILRRESRVDATPESYACGVLTLDAGSQQVYVDGSRCELTVTEFELLREMLSHAGRMLSREQLSRVALGRRPLPHDRALDMHVSNLRRKLGAAGEYIHTVRGRGYRIEPDA